MPSSPTPTSNPNPNRHIKGGTYWPSYKPSEAAAIIFTALYFVATLIGLFQTFRKRSWIWLIMMFASLMELVGYAFRIVSIHHQLEEAPFAVSFVLIIMAPVVIAGAIYVLFGRIVFYVTPRELQNFKFLWTSPRFLTLIFVVCDLFAFVLQGIGAVQISTGTTKSTINRGKSVVLFGLGVQLIAFGFFSVIGIRFNIQSRHFGQSPDTNRIAGNRKTPVNPNWMGLLIGLNIACGMILVRSIYRVVEFASGQNGYVDIHEWTFFIFDALPIFPIFLLFILMPPGNYVPYMGWRVPRKSLAAEHQLEAR